MTWTIDGCISMQNLDIVRGGNRIAMLDCENESLCDADILANARLIAAAPDLLAVLEWWQAQMRDDNCDDMGKLLDEMSTKAHAAIAKAKGN